jgi:hypothetical protein
MTVYSLTNKGKKWTPEQESLVVEQYTGDICIGILEIAKDHKRTVEGVIGKLKTLGHIQKYARSEDYLDQVTGYSEYLEDTDFLEAERLTRVKKAPVRLLGGAKLVSSDSSSDDVQELRDELKKTRKKLKDLEEIVNTMQGQMLVLSLKK